MWGSVSSIFDIEYPTHNKTTHYPLAAVTGSALVYVLVTISVYFTPLPVAAELERDTNLTLVGFRTSVGILNQKMDGVVAFGRGAEPVCPTGTDLLKAVMENLPPVGYIPSLVLSVQELQSISSSGNGV